jgi:hypothetical protein
LFQFLSFSAFQLFQTQAAALGCLPGLSGKTNARLIRISRLVMQRYKLRIFLVVRAARLFSQVDGSQNPGRRQEKGIVSQAKA